MTEKQREAIKGARGGATADLPAPSIPVALLRESTALDAEKGNAMRKDEIDFREGCPAVNVKCYEFWPKNSERNPEWPEDFTEEWARERLSEDTLSEWWWDACAFGFERLQTDAEECFPGWSVQVYSAGRSGGWAIVEGLPPVADWDAIMLSRWARYARWARQQADDVPYLTADMIYHNVYLTDREDAARQRAVNRAMAEYAGLV